MGLALILSVFPEVGSGTSIGERYILEPQQHQYLKVKNADHGNIYIMAYISVFQTMKLIIFSFLEKQDYQHKKFNKPFGEVRFNSKNIILLC